MAAAHDGSEELDSRYPSILVGGRVHVFFGGGFGKNGKPKPMEEALIYFEDLDLSKELKNMVQFKARLCADPFREKERNNEKTKRSKAVHFRGLALKVRAPNQGLGIGAGG